jgi:hypothetical protein
LQYRLSPEIKTEKVKMENPLAEQTITDSLAESALLEPRPAATSKFQAAPIPERPATEHTEQAASEAKPATGFKPRYKAGATKPAQPVDQPSDENKTEETPVPDKPKAGFTPRFKPGVTKAADASAASQPEENKTQRAPVADNPKVGFTPRFKAGITKPPETPQLSGDNTSDETPPPAEKPKVGFTPRFKAGVTKASTESANTPAAENKTGQTENGVTKPAAEVKEESQSAVDAINSTEVKKPEEPPVENKPKIGFTPRFKAGVTKPAIEVKEESESAPSAPEFSEEKKTEELPTESKPQMGFKPRFKAASPPKQQDPPAEQ